MMKSFGKFWQNYAVFGGRTDKKDYWFAFLANAIIFVVLAVVKFFVPIVKYIMVAYAIVCLCPSLAAAVRRLHDTGKSGKLLFLLLIPVVGEILILVKLCGAGNDEDNPYEETAEAEAKDEPKAEPEPEEPPMYIPPIYAGDTEPGKRPEKAADKAAEPKRVNETAAQAAKPAETTEPQKLEKIETDAFFTAPTDLKEKAEEKKEVPVDSIPDEVFERQRKINEAPPANYGFGILDTEQPKAEEKPQKKAEESSKTAAAFSAPVLNTEPAPDSLTSADENYIPGFIPPEFRVYGSDETDVQIPYYGAAPVYGNETPEQPEPKQEPETVDAQKAQQNPYTARRPSYTSAPSAAQPPIPEKQPETPAQKPKRPQGYRSRTFPYGH